jgi:hypothetical protein
MTNTAGHGGHEVFEASEHVFSISYSNYLYHELGTRALISSETQSGKARGNFNCKLINGKNEVLTRQFNRNS